MKLLWIAVNVQLPLNCEELRSFLDKEEHGPPRSICSSPCPGPFLLQVDWVVSSLCSQLPMQLSLLQKAAAV